MSNPNRKFRTLTQMCEEVRANACPRCDVWRVISKDAPLATLEEAQKHTCKCSKNCGWEFCAQYVLPPTLAEEPESYIPPFTIPESDDMEDEPDLDYYDREQDYWSWPR